MVVRRDFLKVVNLPWITPVVSSVTLPVHATTSNSTWQFEIEYNKSCDFCGSDFETIVELDNPITESRVFDVSPQEIEALEFSTTFDFDGSGPVSDFSSYFFMITSISVSNFIGTVERRDADVPQFFLRGNFEAKKI